VYKKDWEIKIKLMKNLWLNIQFDYFAETFYMAIYNRIYFQNVELVEAVMNIRINFRAKFLFQ